MRSLARWGSLSLLMAPLGSWALGLGEIETNSYLNQPLRAEIPLTATPEELQGLRVALAPASAFTQQGLDYPAVLGSVSFEVARNAAGQNVIRVTSRQSVAEPFLTMLVEVSSGRSRFQREFSVLLDPPLFLPAQAQPEPITAPATREPEPRVAGGAIERPAPAPRPAQTAPAPAPRAQQAETSPAAAEGGSYTVQSGDTLWGIAQRYRAAGVTSNQTMLSIFEANPAAFEGNINRLRRGAILRIPPASGRSAITASAATSEVRRQMDEWRELGQGSPRLVLIPPTEEPASGGAVSASAADSTRVSALEDQVDDLQAELASTRAELANSTRLLQLRNEELADLQSQVGDATPPPAEPAQAEAAPEPEVAPSDQIFAEEEPDTDAASAEPVAEEPVAARPQQSAPPVVAAPSGPSLVDRVIETVTKPVVMIGAAVVVVLFGGLAFLRRRREDLEDVTGQWEALEAELDDEADNAATARLRTRSGEPSMVVVEGHDGDATAEEKALGGTVEIESIDGGAGDFGDLGDMGGDTGTARIDSLASAGDELPAFDEEPELAEQTLSSQTVINLDQADPIAEADFHMAYGLYDQAADLVSKALEDDPDSKALKLKLLEVYFVWGNKEAFLESAQALKSQIGAGPDWDKVVIMGKQICPDEALFSEATAAAGEIDLDLDSSAEGPGLDFAFDDSSDEEQSLDFAVDDGDLSLAQSGQHPKAGHDDDMLDIGAQTQAGLEAALLEEFDESTARTAPGSEFSDLDATMESPTIETESALSDDDFTGLELESPSFDIDEVAASDAPTVETPTIESARPKGAAGETLEQLGLAGGQTAEMTAEIELDDLGLDVSDLTDMTGEISELPSGVGDEIDDELLSATGVTQVLHDDEVDLEDTGISFTGTAVLGDEDATMMAPGLGDDDVEVTGIRTAVLEKSVGDFDPGSPATEDDLDLNLDDFSSALDGGADTVEQPVPSRFSSMDMDIGADLEVDDAPTGTEEFNPLDPQTMTEVGTKLDLARAYIDMGDPEGAKSILEEVLSEGDAGQRSEAQALIRALPA